MIPLDSEAWASLRHAYGPAGDIPGLLAQLERDPGPKGSDDEPWFSLWSALCHQDDVYEASYAALPHIVSIGAAAAGPIDFSFFLLPACIEVARHNGRGPPIPDLLGEGYFAGLSDLSRCVAVHALDALTEDTVLCAAAALAVSKGHHRLAGVLTAIDSDMFDKILNLEV